MDIIKAAVATVPVPYLSPVFSLFVSIYTSVEQIKDSKKQLLALSETTAHLLITLQTQHKEGRLSKNIADGPLADLQKLLEEILDFVTKERSRRFLQLLFTKDDRIAQIAAYHHRAASFVQAFQVSSLISIQDWQARNDIARDEDQRALRERFTELEHNQHQLLNVLQVGQKDSMITSRQPMKHRTGGPREQEFYSNILQGLSDNCGSSIALDDSPTVSVLIPDGEQVELGEHKPLHAVVAGLPTEVSQRPDTPTPGRDLDDSKKHLYVLSDTFTTIPKSSTETYLQSNNLTHREDRRKRRFRASHLTAPKPSTDAFKLIGPDEEWKDQRKHGPVPYTTISRLSPNPSWQPATFTTDRTHGSASDAQATSITLSPPMSYISGKKHKSGIFNMLRQPNLKTSNQRSISMKDFAKPGHSETTSTSIEVKDLSEDQVIIAVMGPTGTGKSSFIHTATGGDVIIGHELQSCTTEINMVKVHSFEGTDFDIVFIDTPGFDDTNRSDVEILEMLANWLNTTYRSKITLAGILYFHRITDNRMAGTPLKNLRMFIDLCGKKALENIILVTTMWDEVDKDVGSQREKELRGKYWKKMIDQGSATARYHGTLDSAWSIVEHFTTKRRAVLLQKEMVDLGKDLPDTRAGREFYTTVDRLIRKERELFEKIRVETSQLGDMRRDPRVLQALTAEYQGIQEKLVFTTNEIHDLSLASRLLSLIRSPVGMMGSKIMW